jgi:hypothetical protein
VRWFLYVPGGTENEKFDGETLGFLIEGGSATVDGVVRHTVDDLAARGTVRLNPNIALGVVYILPFPDIAGPDNRILTLIGL